MVQNRVEYLKMILITQIRKKKIDLNLTGGRQKVRNKRCLTNKDFNLVVGTLNLANKLYHL